MRRWFLAPLALLLLGSNPSNETVPPQCTVAQVAAGTCAPSKLGTRIRISNGNVATGDTNCAVGTGAFTILCEFDGTNWIQVIPGTATEANNLSTITTGIGDDQVPVGTGAANTAAYKNIPSCSAEGETLNYDIATNSFICLVDGGAVGGTVSVVGDCNGPNCFDGAEGDILTGFTTGEKINLATANTFIFERNDAGTVTFQGADNASPANTIYSTTGSGTATLGGPSVNLANIVSNNDVEIELDDDATGSIQSFTIRDGSNAAIYSLSEVGESTITAASSPSLAFNNTGHAGSVATTGDIRMENGSQICSRNVGGTANLCIGTDTSNRFSIDQALILSNSAAPSELLFKEGLGGSDTLKFIAPSSITTSQTCVLQNDGDFIPDSCVGNGVDDTLGVEANDLSAATTGIADNQIAMGTGANVSTYKTMPSTGTTGCAGPGEALQYNTTTNEWACTTDLASGCVELSADEITCLNTDGCTAGTVNGTNNSFVTANFGTSFIMSGTWNFIVPNGWTGRTISVQIDWTSDHADCNNEAADDVCFIFDSGSVANDGAFLNVPLGGTINGMNDTCIANGDLMRETRAGYIHGMTDGQRGIFLLSRDVAGTPTGCASSDDFTQEAKVIGVRLCRE